ncbi:uncharacterized protein LOC111832127 [Capsella rubella]|uniref:uncharacterized protein LOC111832127 n=1 Tax=Capsella rubella TaxID=81985 RepID=UPI000CD4A87E|nr:uncharacterized protein LOC111832127 [Capsella rubella]
MSSAMDKAMLAMSLEEEDEVPFEMPDLPEFSSVERNSISLIGRTLNPSCQPMKNLIRVMPRKWQKPGRMRGVALSNEKFQFIFDSEHDLLEVLAKGTHTYNDWSLAVDRWYESPPANYLQCIPIWVQIWNLPVNFFTVKAITALGELIGEVKEVAFDPDIPQIQEFVRVKVLFDVSRPLRRAKELKLPKGGVTTIRFQYERIQKRCYECQRLTHEKDYCPILIKKREDDAAARRAGRSVPKPTRVPFLKESDPLFGILREDQVGLDPATGRQRIAADVLEGMRQYLLVNNNEDRHVKANRIKKSVSEVEKDPIAKKTILRMETAPIVHVDVNKDKGIVFGFEEPELVAREEEAQEAGTGERVSGNLVMKERTWLVEEESNHSSDALGSFLALSQPFQDRSTGFSTGFFEAGTSRSKSKKGNQRKRPPSRIRKPKPKLSQAAMEDQLLHLDLSRNVKEKRKAEDGGPSTAKLSKLNPLKVIPNEGSPNG